MVYLQRHAGSSSNILREIVDTRIPVYDLGLGTVFKFNPSSDDLGRDPISKVWNGHLSLAFDNRLRLIDAALRRVWGKLMDTWKIHVREGIKKFIWWAFDFKFEDPKFIVPIEELKKVVSVYNNKFRNFAERMRPGIFHKSDIPKQWSGLVGATFKKDDIILRKGLDDTARRAMQSMFCCFRAVPVKNAIKDNIPISKQKLIPESKLLDQTGDLIKFKEVIETNLGIKELRKSMNLHKRIIEGRRVAFREYIGLHINRHVLNNLDGQFSKLCRVVDTLKSNMLELEDTLNAVFDRYDALIKQLKNSNYKQYGAVFDQWHRRINSLDGDVKQQISFLIAKWKADYPDLKLDDPKFKSYYRGIMETLSARTARSNIEIESARLHLSTGHVRAYFLDVWKGMAMEGIGFLFGYWVSRDLMDKGIISQETYDAAMAENLLGLAFGGIEELLENLAIFGGMSGGSIVSAITAAAPYIAAIVIIYEVVMMLYQAGYFIYLELTTPAMSMIWDINIQSDTHNLEKWGSYEIGDTLTVSQVYTNTEGILTLWRDHFDLLALRTQFMPENSTPIEHPWWYWNVLEGWLFRPNGDEEWPNPPNSENWYWSMETGMLGFPVENRHVEVSIPLEDVSRNTELTMINIYGLMNEYYSGTSGSHHEVTINLDLWHVVENDLSSFLQNTEMSCDLSNDMDDDGLSSAQEFQYGTNIRSNDTDADNITDYDEINVYRSNPMKADSDSDGLADYAEILLGCNLTNFDSDDDYLDDNLEYSIGSNPLSNDTDSDGVYDGTEFVLCTSLTSSDTDLDSCIDITEIRLGYNPRDANDSPISVSQFETTPIGFYQGTHTFNAKQLGSDPWFTSASYGNAFISSSMGTPVHNFVYVLNCTSARPIQTNLYMTSDWQVESWVNLDNLTANSAFGIEVMMTSGIHFAFRYNNATHSYQYSHNFKDWESFATSIPSSELDNWSVWAINWDASLKKLTFSVDWDADTTAEYSKELTSATCSFLDCSFGGISMNLVVFKGENVGYAAIDSVSMWSGSDIFGYSIGDLYDLIEFPDVYTEVNEDSSTISFECAQIDGMQMGIYYDDETFASIESDTLFIGPFENVATISLEHDGEWYFEPVAIFDGCYFPLGNPFMKELITYNATYVFDTDGLGSTPAGFITNGLVTVNETQDILDWYGFNPYTAIYRYVNLNDTSANAVSSMKRIVTHIIEDGDFIEFWWRTDNATFESDFIIRDDLKDMFSISINDGYFWFKSGNDLCNTSIEVIENSWYHMHISLSQSNWTSLFIDSQFIDNFWINSSGGISNFNFTTSVSDIGYSLSVKGIGISWYGYGKFGNGYES